MFLLILSLYYVNSSMFYHSHELQGETIFHSHFYSQKHTSQGDGNHSLEVIKLIASLNNILIEEQSPLCHVEMEEPLLEYVACAEATQLSKFYVEYCRSLRAPPTL
ncbi:MAG: hypothetical protein SNI51_06150 [Rikenellaceae bacterium]